MTWAARPPGLERADEPGGADRGRTRLLLLDGVRARARPGGDAAPERLSTSATVTFVPGTGITKSALEVEGVVPGLDADGFRQAAEAAKDGCPVSQALKGNVELSVSPSLSG